MVETKKGERPLPEWARLYLDRWLDLLMLAEWRVTAYVDKNETGPGLAQVTITRNTQTAVISFDPAIPEAGSAEELREWRLTIIHEALHIRLANLTYCITDDILTQFGNQAHQVAYSAFDSHLEQLIENLAHVLYSQEVRRK